MIFQGFSQNKYKRKKKNHRVEQPWVSSGWFWETREELFPVLELKEEKLTFTIIEWGKMDFFPWKNVMPFGPPIVALLSLVAVPT
jgi:hypothetical protein